MEQRALDPEPGVPGAGACQAPALRHVIGGSEALIHHAPERPDGLGLVIEEILEEARFADG